MSAADQAFEVQAGASISIRWGGDISALFGKAVAADTATWTLNVFYDTGQNLWETTATDSLTQTASRAYSMTVLGVLSITPTTLPKMFSCSTA